MASASKTSGRKGAGLHACPFCRELFVDGEHDQCPECGVELRELAALPLSAEAQALEHEDVHAGVATAPQAEPLPWTDMSRGRGPLLALALTGFAVFFFAPFVLFTEPANSTLTAFHMARSSKIVWSLLVAWMILVPAVLSRRSILQMWGGRVACAFLSAVPGVYSLIALSGPTSKATNIPGVLYRWHWGPGVYATIVISIVATYFAVRLGGPIHAEAAPSIGTSNAPPKRRRTRR
jgi:hypothetical protein